MTRIQVSRLEKENLLAAAELFVEGFKGLRRGVPALPDRLETPERVAGRLERLLPAGHALAAWDGARLAGYLGWFLVDGFRGTGRRAAYCPEWAHAARPAATRAGSQAHVYLALYRAAAAGWLEAGCQVHALTMLAGDPAEEKFWFWNGFGLAVVDAVRPMRPLGAPLPPAFSIRKANPEDTGLLAVLDEEHVRHYTEPPVLMAAPERHTAGAFAEFLKSPHNSAWLAFAGDEPAGLMIFEGSSFGAADIVNAPDTVAITGAYLRPAWRGYGAAAAMLDAALVYYTGQGMQRCSVDFESFNPEAAAFWLKYFEPVAFSVQRVPERTK